MKQTEQSNFCKDGKCTANSQKSGVDCIFYEPDNHTACIYATWGSSPECTNNCAMRESEEMERLKNKKKIKLLTEQVYSLLNAIKIIDPSKSIECAGLLTVNESVWHNLEEKGNDAIKLLQECKKH